MFLVPFYNHWSSGHNLYMAKFFRHIWESKSRQIILNKQILFTFYYFFFNIHYKIVRYEKERTVAYKSVFSNSVHYNAIV